MSTAAHIISASYITARAANILPHETDYLIIAAASAGILDLDHIFFLIRDRKFYKKNGYNGQLHNARSAIHELFGFLVAGIITLALSFFNLKLAFAVGLPFTIHLIQDLIMGTSIPFTPIDKTHISFIPQKRPLKVVVDIIVIVVFSLLWIQYLNA